MKQSSASRYALPRTRNAILASLLVLAAACWALLFWQAAMPGMGSGPTLGMRAIVFLAMWVVMMIAMMFPTAAPMILMFARVHSSKRERGQPFVPTWVFVSGYLLIWTLAGAVAYILALGAEALAHRSHWLMDHTVQLGGVLLMLAGLYQLSPLKRACLAKCRTPLDFILGAWRDGYGGALHMGIEHGVYCLGCCWLLFLILFPLGLMNMAAMIAVTLLIFAEKSLPLGWRIPQLAALALIAYGVVAFFTPAVFPVVTF